MAKVQASADGVVGASPATVYGYLADMHQHQRFLPPAFSDFAIESGGNGAGTVTRFKVTAGGRTRDYRMEVTEPEPGRILQESDTTSSLVTTFTVDPEGEMSRVRITTTWDGAGGVGGFFERLFAPRAMGRIYADELSRLDAYARAQAGQA
jgi:hypothetical protein